MVNYGVLDCKKQPDGTNVYRFKNGSIDIISYIISPNDPRYLPRIGKKYINLESLITNLFNQNNILNENEIENKLAQEIVRLKQKVKEVMPRALLSK